ncbi:MAG TPA: TPM domain-containing protein [Pyrinomonadaceae bacterium]|nr:TPM domain-containing protein [Pyrinomonadaceae bacterium]
MRFRTKASSLRVGLGLLASLFLFVVQLQAQTRPQPPVPLPTPFTPIVDYANVIDADTRQRLESIYLNLKDRGGCVYSVLTVQTTGEQDIFDYSLAVARGWGIGPKDAENPSFLLVIAIQDRKYFTLVSQHLEGDLPDGLVGRIQRERLVPAFKQSNYSKGIYDTVQAYVATIASKRGFSVEGIDQRYAYSDGSGNQPASGIRELPGRVGLRTICCGIVVVIFIVILISNASRGGPGGRGGRRRRRGFGGGGIWEALFWGSVLGNLSGGGRGWGSSSGWGGSGGFGGGGFGGGGGGGFGGGFGGGDSFGGGGAGGSW